MTYLINRKKNEITEVVVDSDGNDDHDCWNERDRINGPTLASSRRFDYDPHRIREVLYHNEEPVEDRDGQHHCKGTRR